MTLQLWGLTGEFGYGLPLRWLGYLLLLASLALILWKLIDHRRRGISPLVLGWPLPGSLILAGAAAQAAFVLYLPAPGGLSNPGLPLEPSGQAGPLFGLIPLILAAGWLGSAPAAVVGLVAGFIVGGWYTHSLLTPASLTLTAMLAAWTLRRPYRDILGSAARRPIVATLLAGLALAGLRGLELFVYSGGPILDGVEYVLAQSQTILQAAMIQALLAGLVGEGVLFLFPARWTKPARLVSAPYLRSLGTRMVAFFLLVGMVAGVVLLVGDWALARASARDLVEAQMEQTAIQAGGGVPFFIQTGRSFLQQAAELASRMDRDQLASGEALRPILASFPYFQAVAYFDSSGQRTGFASLAGGEPTPLSLEAEAALAASLAGVPQEITGVSGSQPPSSEAIFLAPVAGVEGGEVIGVLAGWTQLSSNPLLQPVGTVIAEFPAGTALIANENGTILMHSDRRQVGGSTLMANAVSSEVFDLTAPDGTRQLAFVYPVPGSSWVVVLTVPGTAVDRLAIEIAARLFAVMAVAGVVVVLLAYAVSRTLTRPLRQMTLAAESIARGNLDRPVPGVGEDEVGRLASALERMRRSLKIRLEEMDLLLQATQRMAASFNLAEVLPPILMGVQDLTESDFVRVALAPRDGETGDLERYTSGVDPGGWTTLDRQLLDLSRERGRFVLENPARARAVLDLRLLTEPMEGLLALPMRSEEEFVGTLWIGYRRPHVFSSDETSLLTILAGQLGVSVANARLYQRAEQERLRLGATLEATPDAVLLLDPEGNVVHANPAAAMVLRVSPEQARRKPIAQVVGVPRLDDMLRAGVADPVSGEISLADGRVLFASVLELEGVGPHRGGKVCVLRDITHYKKLDMLKSEFVATVSHDLRTPLTLMRGYGTMLSMVGTLNDQQKEFSRKILDSVDQMARLVDGLLDLGRIEAGVGLSLETVEPGAILEEVVSTYRPQAANKQISLTVEMPDTMTAIDADATLLRQAVANLVDNAIKYTPAKGRVKVSAAQAEGMQIFRVEDSGVGIAPADQPRLFEKFYRAGGANGGRESGSGLGLAIVKSIAEQHGGRISVESRLGSGSTFVLEVPVHQSRSLPG
ncbi:MAG TPA: ATP-binding protein [Anaerolineales bacterium]|nr:ATP-binding protein [Anaerolineales bacterium]